MFGLRWTGLAETILQRCLQHGVKLNKSSLKTKVNQLQTFMFWCKLNKLKTSKKLFA